MELTRIQFDTLSAMATGVGEKEASVLPQLESAGYISGENVTKSGFEALEPYRVKSAVFLAAGLGSRLMPLTKETPKPLVKVFGKSFIERLLDACVAAEIEKIYIVVGYLKEKFYPLKEKYPQIEFIENPKYDRSATLYSVYCALDKFENTYLLESDLLLSNMSLVRKYNYRSVALGIKVDKTDDWCWTADKEKRATWCKMGGEDCYLFEGIVYFDKDSSKILKSVVKETVKNIPDSEKWDIANAIYTERLKDYYMEIRECQFEDIIEIDSYEELKAVDKSYK